VPEKRAWRPSRATSGEEIQGSVALRPRLLLPWTVSVRDSQPELDHAWRRTRSDPSEVRRGDASGGRAELRAVAGILEFGAELHVDPLADALVSVDADVEARDPRAAQIRLRSRVGAEREGRRGHERGAVEPGVERLRLGRKHG